VFYSSDTRSIAPYRILGIDSETLTHQKDHPCKSRSMSYEEHYDVTICDVFVERFENEFEAAESYGWR
jgi:hypothetical protein